MKGLNLHRTIATFLCFLLLLGPVSSSAEEIVGGESASTSAAEITTSPAIPADPAPSAEVVPDADSPQETAPSQTTIESSLLETTVNPQVDPGTPAVPDAVLPDNTDPVAPIDQTPVEAVEVPAPDVAPDVSIPVPVVDPSINIQPIVADEVPDITPMDVVELKPKKEYTFELQGRAIPTNAKTDWTKSQTEKEKITPTKQVTSSVSLDLAPDQETLEVSGLCKDPYYVVLLYKSAEDYDKSPSSYIFNKAFDCVGGNYTYAISDLPKDLASGTYYLLIGGQGNKGGWKPISSLSPIIITNQKDAE